MAIAEIGWGQSQPQEANPPIAAPTAGASPATPAALHPAPSASQAVSAPIPSSMAESLEKQRAAILKQAAVVSGKAPQSPGSFFTVPWIETGSHFSVPLNAPCEPLGSDQLDPLIEASSKQEGVKADLLRAVVEEESGRKPCAVSFKGAQGLMQLMPATAEQLGVKDPFDPRQNVEGGAKLLKQLIDKYNGDLSLALSAYNAGAGRVDRDGGVPDIPETTNYVTDILGKLPKQ